MQAMREGGNEEAMNYRNPRLLKLAAHYPCQYCGADDGTIVAAHSNRQRHGKGMGIKAHDLCIAFLCNSCHDAVDRQNDHLLWLEAHSNTVALIAARHPELLAVKS